MHAKALACSADNVMLDLEDSVPVDQKNEARKQVIETLGSAEWGAKTITVRCNGLDPPFAYRDLIDLASEVGHRLDAVVVPKINHPGDIHFVHRLLDGVEMDRQPGANIGIEASIESAQGLENISVIANASDPHLAGPGQYLPPPSARVWYLCPGMAKVRLKSIQVIAGTSP